MTDPDSRSMARDGKATVGYNVQKAVDDKHKLIVVQEVTNAITDVDQLSRITKEAKEALGVDEVKVVADIGYYNGKQIRDREKEGIEPYINKPLPSANTKLGLFGKEKFVYDSKKECYRCPAGEKLTYRSEGVERGRHIRYYATGACGTREIKAKYTRNKRGRRITRWVDEHILERMAKRVKANPQLMVKRKRIVEHPFGTIRFWSKQGCILMRGLEKVRAEMSLSTSADNINRAINILGVQKMIEALA